MEARGEEILMKKIYDLRGPQSRIFRLYSFYKSALLHMITYRLLIFESPIAAAAIILEIIRPSPIINIVSDSLILLTWILFTPQLFSAAEAFSIISTKAASFGHLNKSFIAAQWRKPNPLFNALPFVASAIWAMGFILLAFKWFA